MNRFLLLYVLAVIISTVILRILTGDAFYIEDSLLVSTITGLLALCLTYGLKKKEDQTIRVEK